MAQERLAKRFPLHHRRPVAWPRCREAVVRWSRRSALTQQPDGALHEHRPNDSSIMQSDLLAACSFKSATVLAARERVLTACSVSASLERLLCSHLHMNHLSCTRRAHVPVKHTTKSSEEHRSRERIEQFRRRFLRATATSSGCCRRQSAAALRAMRGSAVFFGPNGEYVSFPAKPRTVSGTS